MSPARGAIERIRMNRQAGTLDPARTLCRPPADREV
jgi:hypothetical protein